MIQTLGHNTLVARLVMPVSPETWEQSLKVMHNPYAAIPLPP